jgi:hypothetical protein
MVEALEHGWAQRPVYQSTNKNLEATKEQLHKKICDKNIFQR